MDGKIIFPGGIFLFWRVEEPCRQMVQALGKTRVPGIAQRFAQWAPSIKMAPIRLNAYEQTHFNEKTRDFAVKARLRVSMIWLPSGSAHRARWGGSPGWSDIGS